MFYPYYIAKRFIRHRKQVEGSAAKKRFVSAIIAISLGAVALGTATLIVALSILAGFEQTLTDNVIGYTAHAEIASFGNRPLGNYPATINALKSDNPHITTIIPFVEQEAVLRSSRGIAGVVIQGVPVNDTMTLAYKRVVEGRAPSDNISDSIPEIIISKGTAKELQTSVGKMLTIFRFIEGLQSREDLIKNIARFKVIGIFETGMTEYDNNLAYTTLASAQHLRNLGPLQVSGYRLNVNDLSKVKEICNEIKQHLHYPYFIESVFDIYPTIFGWIELQKKPIPIILGLIILVAAFNVISTLLILVIEKTRQVGVLKSLGATDRSILAIFISEGAYIALLGIGIGNLLAFIISWLQLNYHFFKLRADIYFMSSVPISIEWQHYVVVSMIALIITISSAIIPARIATKITPVKALKFG